MRELILKYVNKTRVACDIRNDVTKCNLAKTMYLLFQTIDCKCCLDNIKVE